MTPRIPARRPFAVLIALFACLLFGCTSLATAIGNLYLTLDGIPGDSQSRQFPNSILALTYELKAGAEDPASAATATGAAGSNRTAGGSRRSLSPLVITKQYDKSSALLLAAALDARSIRTATLTLTRSDSRGDEIPAFEIRLEDVAVQNFTQGGTFDAIPQETVILSFSKITFVPYNKDPRGANTPGRPTTYDSRSGRVTTSDAAPAPAPAAPAATAATTTAEEGSKDSAGKEASKPSESAKSEPASPTATAGATKPAKRRLFDPAPATKQ